MRYSILISLFCFAPASGALRGLADGGEFIDENDIHAAWRLEHPRWLQNAEEETNSMPSSQSEEGLEGKTGAARKEMGKMMASKAPNTALPPATPTFSRPDGSPSKAPNTALPPATPTFSRPDGSPSKAPNTALPPATPTVSRPDGSPATAPTASGGGLTETSFIPICKQDAFGKYVQWNDRDYDSPNTKVVTSKLTTFASTNKNYELANKAVVDFKSITVSVVSLPTLAENLKKNFATIGAAAGVLSLGLNLLGPLTGFGGQSPESAVLQAVTEGFRVLSGQLTEL
jgi:hypothetical protein